MFNKASKYDVSPDLFISQNFGTNLTIYNSPLNYDEMRLEKFKIKII